MIAPVKVPGIHIFRNTLKTSMAESRIVVRPDGMNRSTRTAAIYEVHRQTASPRMLPGITTTHSRRTAIAPNTTRRL